MSGLIAVPRWSGTPDSDFYPWLSRSLPETRVSVLDLPDRDAPVIDDCVAALRDAMSGQAGGALLLGHSVGCQIVMRTLATWDGPRPRAVLLVAPWFEIDEPWETIEPWLETPIATDAVRAAAPSIRALLSDNDPFTADFERTRDQLEERLSASVRVVPGARHFNGEQEPAVLEEVRDLLGARPAV